jgi:sulfite reductase (NADPH) flavoprotein alpha-component
MSINTRPPVVSLIAENAPFTPEQREWLNGFFAGLLSLEEATTPLSAAQAATLIPGSLAAPSATEPSRDDVDDGEAPWHDQMLPIAERMKLAEGRPLRGRMMAAMAQQDCGRCGYDCARYADALFLRKEVRLNLCVPGGKATARMLKQLYEQMEPAPLDSVTRPATAVVSSAPAPTARTTPGTSRDHPAEAVFLSRTRLNRPGSGKYSWHVEFDLRGSGIDYQVGDCFGVFAANDPALADAVIGAIEAPSDFPIGGRTLRDVLIDGVSLSPAPDMLFQLISYVTGGERRRKAKALAAGEDPDGDAATLDVLGTIEKFRPIRPDPEAFIEALDPLQPRLYSISSSPKTHPGRVSLTVEGVRYTVNGRTRVGVASTFLAERVRPGDKVKVHVQKARGFGLPTDPSVPIIMVGPGTGIAPFRAFLHERMATKAGGRNWLFFGHQRRDCDFFYEHELAGMKAAGVLTRLSLAWSRDGDRKLYVQDRMREAGRELWAWLADGAHLYVCGDAQRMSKDVERAFIDITVKHGMRSADEAIAFIAALKRSGQYQQDAY